VLPGGSGGSAGAAGQKSTAGATFGGMPGTGGVNSGGTASPGGGGSVSGGSAGAGTAGLSGGGSKSNGGVSGGGAGGSSSGGASGGSTSGGSGGAMIPGPNFDTVKFVIENVTCFGGLCHDLAENRLNLRVNQMNPDLHTRLTTHMTKECGKLVNTANPAESALVKILKGPCGATPRMPSDGCMEDGDVKCVPPNFIDAIQQWIAAGAPK
jgi:hypothetical protein